MSKPLPPPLPPLDPDPELVAALSLDTGIEAAVVRSWLAGERRVSTEIRDRLRESLWAPLRKGARRMMIAGSVRLAIVGTGRRGSVANSASNGAS